ncbi:hypothetical protein [Candidatus Uabimicrobium sp. HlEnr_7]|uniref:hypothetical protein n=1 Tax=Candidatus Uabimicrobium helgolandensis TaxID=3095367 RepID=UPI0035582AB4
MKSISAIAILGIFTTILLIIMMLFTLESSPTIKNTVSMANEIEFDQNLDFVSIAQTAEKCRVLIVSSVSKDDDLKKEIQKIGNYIWRKFSIEAGFEELEIIFQGKVGSGCYQDTVIVKSNIENPIKRK